MKSPGRIIFGAILLTGCAVAVGFMVNGQLWRVPLEAGLLAVGTILLISRAPVQAFIVDLPNPHRIVFAAIFGGMLAGQFWAEYRLFPFAPWNMYGRPDPRPDPESAPHLHLMGTRENGETISIRMIDLYPSLGELRANTLLERMAAVRPHPVVDGTLEAVGVRYNRGVPDKPIHTLQIIRRTSRLSDPHAAPTEEILSHTEVPR
jgi:hypothetical protein